MVFLMWVKIRLFAISFSIMITDSQQRDEISTEYLILSPLFFLQSEMKLIAVDTETLKQHFGKKILELEEEKRKVQVELDLFNFK